MHSAQQTMYFMFLIVVTLFVLPEPTTAIWRPPIWNSPYDGTTLLRVGKDDIKADGTASEGDVADEVPINEETKAAVEEAVQEVMQDEEIQQELKMIKEEMMKGAFSDRLKEEQVESVENDV